MAVKLVDAASVPGIRQRLAADPGRHAWALQDLEAWPERTRLYVREPGLGQDSLDYLLFTGHPGAARTLTVVLEGTPDGVRPLLAKLPEGPWLMRETPASLLAVVKEAAPQAQIYRERRMEVTRATFRPAHRSGAVRRLVAEDAGALADFQGAPPQAAPGLVSWIRGATLLGLWEGERLMATASTFVRIPEVWELVAVATRPEARGKGYATDVTSTLTAMGLQEAAVVSLTVLSGNEPALGLYAKLGFQAREDRIWVDNGTGSAPG